MAIQRMDHVGVVVDDLKAATAFFLSLCYIRGPEVIIVAVAEQLS